MKEVSLKSLTALGKRTTNGCLEWQFCLSKNGYGKVWFQKKIRMIHRVVAHLAHGVDLENPNVKVRHSCDNRKCYEPTHLLEGTQKDNMADAIERGRPIGRPKNKTCLRGHKLTTDNLNIRPNGKRSCKTCDKLTRTYRELRSVGVEESKA